LRRRDSFTGAPLEIAAGDDRGAKRAVESKMETVRFRIIPGDRGKVGSG